MDKKIKTIELFCGIGGFRLACDALSCDTIWANDINKLSCRVYEDNFGKEILHEGDIRELHSAIPCHDLLTAGFPCQPFSSAGKKMGIRDPKGTLFQEIIKILDSHSPSFFVLENVKRLLSMENGNHFETILSMLSKLDYFIEWRLLNASHFGLAQNRERLIIVGSRVSDFSESKITLVPSSDLGSIAGRYMDMLKNYDLWEKLNCHKKRFPAWGIAYKGKCCTFDINYFSEATPKPFLKDFLDSYPNESFFMDETTAIRLKDSVYVNKMINGVRVLYNQKSGARMGYTIFGTDGIAPTLTASHSRHYERYKIGNRFRRLTNTEYARLQGFPDYHCKIASVFNQYALYGNAVPPPLVKWAIDRLINKKGFFQKSFKEMM